MYVFQGSGSKTKMSSMLLLHFHRWNMGNNRNQEMSAEILHSVLAVRWHSWQSNHQEASAAHLKLGKAARPATGSIVHPGVLSDTLDFTTYGCSPRSDATRRCEAEQ